MAGVCDWRARQGTTRNLRSFVFVTKPKPQGITRVVRVKVLGINSYFGGGHAQLGIDNWKKRFGLRLIILLIILYINYFNIFILFFSNLVQRWPKNLHWQEKIRNDWKRRFDSFECRQIRSRKLYMPSDKYGRITWYAPCYCVGLR